MVKNISQEYKTFLSFDSDEIKFYCAGPQASAVCITLRLISKLISLMLKDCMHYKIITDIYFYVACFVNLSVYCACRGVFDL